MIGIGTRLASGTTRLVAAVAVLALAATLLIPATGLAATYTLGSKATGVQSLYGQTSAGTAAKISRAAYPSGVASKKAILVNNKSWQDALCAAPLAGGLNCPILYASEKSLPADTKTALTALKVKDVIVVGNTSSVSMDVIKKLSSLGYGVSRIGGSTVYDTQMAIYAYGAKRKLWSKTTVIAATGKSFKDALSISPVAFKLRVPIFLVKPNGALTTAQTRALSNGSVTRVEIIGGTQAISASTANRLTSIAKSNAKLSKTTAKVERIWGQTSFDTSAAVAKWGVSSKILKWNSAAFARGYVAADALSGSVLQGREGSPILLIEPANETTLKLLKGKGAKVVKIFGGVKAVRSGARADIAAELGWGPKTGYRVMGTSPTYTQAKLVRAFKATGHAYPAELAKKGAKNIEAYCKIFVEEANNEGVRTEVAFAMAMFETGWLQSANARKKCNFCGLGGGGSAAVTFKDVRTGIRAQMQHLKLYASKDPLYNTAAYSRWASTAKYLGRGFAPTVEQLGDRWAAGDSSYGDYLLSMIARLKKA